MRGGFRKESNKSGSSIENRLAGGASNFRETNMKRVAVVNSGGDKSMDYNCSHGGCGNRFTDSSKGPELVVRGTCLVRDMF